MFNVFKCQVADGNPESPSHHRPHVISKKHWILLLLLRWIVGGKVAELHLVPPLADGVEETGDKAVRLVPGPGNRVVRQVVFDEHWLYWLAREEASRLERHKGLSVTSCAFGEN